MKDLNTSFFNLSTIKVPVHSGDLLVAQPFLTEVWFDRAVISLIDHDKGDGATGVVLNNCMNYTLDQVLDGIGEAGKNVDVYCGGPLSQDRLFFIHSLGPEIIPDCRAYSPGLYIGGDFDSAIDYINQGYPTDGYLRFFIGYSGWKGNQLEEEIEANTWAIAGEPADAASLLSGSGEQYWNREVKRLGVTYRSWLFIPRDVHCN